MLLSWLYLRIISVFNAICNRKGISYHKNKMRPKKEPKVTEIKAFGCVPAPITDCVSSNKNIQTVR